MIKVLKINECFILECLNIKKELKHKNYLFSISIKLKSNDKCFIIIKTANKIIKKIHTYIEYPLIDYYSDIILYNDKTLDIELIDDDLLSLIKKSILCEEFMSIDDFEVLGGNND